MIPVSVFLPFSSHIAMNPSPCQLNHAQKSYLFRSASHIGFIWASDSLLCLLMP